MLQEINLKAKGLTEGFSNEIHSVMTSCTSQVTAAWWRTWTCSRWAKAYF